jgi:predicted transposase/invertase (TIGR01784 family)
LTLLQLVTAAKKETPELVAQLLQRAQRESDSERAQVIVELVEELLLRRFTQLNREEVRRMFQLHDLRKSRVWQEAHDEGMEKGMVQAQQEFVQRLIAKGKPLKEIAELLELPLAQVRRLASR